MHADAGASALIALTCAVDGGAVVAGAAEHVLVRDMIGGEDVHAVAPGIPAHDLCVAHRDAVTATNGDLRGERSVDHHILSIAHGDACLLSLGVDEAVAYDAYTLCAINAHPAFDISP